MINKTLSPAVNWKLLAMSLKFLYKLKTRVAMRRYVRSRAILTYENAKFDDLPESKEDFVSELLRTQPRFKDEGSPFKDKRKLDFRGMINLGNGERYQGNWITHDADSEKLNPELIHGRGVYVFSNGSQYVGYFHEGEIFGRGRMIFHNGDIFEGEFENAKESGSTVKYSGFGKYKFGDKHPVKGYYEGEFHDNLITGKGKLHITSTKKLNKLFGQITIDETE
uniref:MORN repeat protein n=1 Tax=Euplotes harpa TaxID=151035 RepID=A0A7S3J606_9SPIT|mmetsp:Transcript_17043/g.19658  ORF Transcript_17043/g.19658 Transcript_17043/m.19658 type:complete len:223 (+) Transcript_17043:99-767(+)